MKLLIDTHLLIWAAESFDRLPAAAQTLMADPDNDLLFSAASIWEVAIKSSRPRDDFTIQPTLLKRGLEDGGYRELAITGDHAIAVKGLPQIHGDPFDRLLVAQATVEGILLLTSDEALARYPGPIRKV